jgi:nitrate reductase NapA
MSLTRRDFLKSAAAASAASAVGMVVPTEVEEMIEAKNASHEHIT